MCDIPEAPGAIDGPRYNRSLAGQHAVNFLEQQTVFGAHVLQHLRLDKADCLCVTAFGAAEAADPVRTNECV